MRIYNISTIRRWQNEHANAREALQRWYRVAITAQWKSLADVRAQYNSADQVGSCLVFNILGNRFRLIAGVIYATDQRTGFLYLKHFLTHAEYNRNDWKKDCQE